MTDKYIKEGNRMIAEFMGYTYYHPGVDIDTSDCGGIYERFEIFSKIPIEVDEYPESDQYYFKEIPNPDYKNENSTRWNSDFEFLGWDTINYSEYIMDLKYHCDWNELMPVCKKIDETYFDMRSKMFDGLRSMDIEKTYCGVIEFLQFFNDPDQKKLIWKTTPQWVIDFFNKNNHKIRE